jgi:hypothetical protein
LMFWKEYHQEFEIKLCQRALWIKYCMTKEWSFVTDLMDYEEYMSNKKWSILPSMYLASLSGASWKDYSI